MSDASTGWPPDAFLYMKVGPHGPESLDEILVRKAREYEATGRIFWGYGGSVLHPRTQVWPFAEKWTARQGSLYVLMERLPKPRRNHIPNTSTATHYSADGDEYVKLPAGVRTGTAFALVLGEIIRVDREIDLRDFRVGAGDSKGKNAAEYVRWHVDKGCFVAATDEPPPDHLPSTPASITYMAEVVPPYCVFLRHGDETEPRKEAPYA